MNRSRSSDSNPTRAQATSSPAPAEGLHPVVAVLQHQLGRAGRRRSRAAARSRPRPSRRGPPRRRASSRRRRARAPGRRAARRGGGAGRSGSCTGPVHHASRSERMSASSALSLPGLARNLATHRPARRARPPRGRRRPRTRVARSSRTSLPTRRTCPEAGEVADVVERVEGPPVALGVVLPGGQAGVRRLDPRAGAGVRDAEQHPQRRLDHPGVAHGHDRLAGVLGREALEGLAHPRVEAVPALPLGAKSRSGSASMSKPP